MGNTFYFLNNLFSINQIEIKITSYPLCTKKKIALDLHFEIFLISFKPYIVQERNAIILFIAMFIMQSDGFHQKSLIHFHLHRKI